MKQYTKKWRGLYITATAQESFYVNYEITKLDYDGDTVIKGTVKWDGCSDWTFPEATIWHFCSLTELKNHSAMLVMCFNWTKEIMGEAWGGDE